MDGLDDSNTEFKKDASKLQKVEVGSWTNNCLLLLLKINFQSCESQPKQML